jgi:hypothetical protein
LVKYNTRKGSHLVKAPWVYNRFIVTRQALIIISKDYWYIKARWVGLINTPEKVIPPAGYTHRDWLTIPRRYLLLVNISSTTID